MTVADKAPMTTEQSGSAIAGLVLLYCTYRTALGAAHAFQSEHWLQAGGWAALTAFLILWTYAVARKVNNEDA